MRNETRHRSPKKFECPKLQTLLYEDEVQIQELMADPENYSRTLESIGPAFKFLNV